MIALCLTSVPVFASTQQAPAVSGSEDNSSTMKIVAIGVAAVVSVSAVILIRSLQIKAKAERYYQQGVAYGAEGKWDLAVDAFNQCAAVKANHKDVQAKLTEARQQAEKMFIGLGDKAKEEEKYEEALAYYQKALSYQPRSTQARAKIDEMSKQLVSIYYRRGRNYETRNLWAEAYQEYEKAYNSNPNYEDLKDRYLRAKAKIEGNLASRAILFFINQSTQLGIEQPLIQALQSELGSVVSSKYYMMDYQRVQTVMTEQAALLGDTLDENLAMDLGRILGVNEVMLGEIVEISGKDGKIKIDLRVTILKVPGKEVVEKFELSHTFSKEVGMAELAQAMPELAKEIAKKMKK